jgi:hypothetical protein
MIKGITLLFSVVFIVNSCKTKKQTSKRTELINKFISAVQNYDTAKLYKIVDTSSYFNVQDKEGFLYLVGYVNSRLKVCSANVIDSNIKIKEVPVHSKEYIVPFCRGKNGEIVYDSFDLLFTFTDYDNDEMIHYIDVVKYRHNVTPTSPLPNQ